MASLYEEATKEAEQNRDLLLSTLREINPSDNLTLNNILRRQAQLSALILTALHELKVQVTSLQTNWDKMNQTHPWSQSPNIEVDFHLWMEWVSKQLDNPGLLRKTMSSFSPPITDELMKDFPSGVAEFIEAETPQSPPSPTRSAIANGPAEPNSECVQSADGKHHRIYFTALLPQSTSASQVGMGWWCRSCGVFSFNGSTLAPAVATPTQSESTSPKPASSPSVEPSSAAESLSDDVDPELVRLPMNLNGERFTQASSDAGFKQLSEALLRGEWVSPTRAKEALDFLSNEMVQRNPEDMEALERFIEQRGWLGQAWSLK